MLNAQVAFTSTTGTVSELNPFTEYTCTISAFTILPGPLSDPAVVTTAQLGNAKSFSNYSCVFYYDNFISVAPDPPVINAIIAINNSTVRVTWMRPTMPNGIITFYTIMYFTDSNSENMSVPYTGEEVSIYILSRIKFTFKEE